MLLTGEWSTSTAMKVIKQTFSADDSIQKPYNV
jgi:hypothetical protein